MDIETKFESDMRDWLIPDDKKNTSSISTSVEYCVSKTWSEVSLDFKLSFRDEFVNVYMTAYEAKDYQRMRDALLLIQAHAQSALEDLDNIQEDFFENLRKNKIEAEKEEQAKNNGR